MPVKPKWTDKKVEEALIKAGGVIAEAARLLDVDRANLSRRIKKSERLSQVKTEALEEMIDLAESKMFEKIREGDKIALIFFLKCHGKNRGWVERQEVTGKDGAPVGEVLAPVRQQSAEEWMKANQIELKSA